jgi:murein DD-endopeptidase MepM/ murein hydrolase activator NlpD
MKRRAISYNSKVPFYKNKYFYKKQLNQVIYVLTILVILLVMKRLNYSVSNNIIGIINRGINHEFSIKEDGKKIWGYAKKLSNVSKKAVEVFNIKSTVKYPPPIDGKIYKTFGETINIKGNNSFNEGIDIIPEENKEPVAISDGVVTKIEDKGNKGYFIYVSHENMDTVYGYLTKVYVKEKDTIETGDILGTLGTNKDGNKYLRFEVWVKGKPVNPIDYIVMK